MEMPLKALIKEIWEVVSKFVFFLPTDPKIQNFMMILIITNSIVLGVQAGE